MDLLSFFPSQISPLVLSKFSGLLLLLHNVMETSSAYLVICSLDGSFINSNRTNSTSLTITGLQPFTNYTCSVRAATIKGDGPAVVKFVVTRKCLFGVPRMTPVLVYFIYICSSEWTVPQNLNISATMHTITLMWSPPAVCFPGSIGVISNYSESYVY